MKKLFFGLFILFELAACEKNEEVEYIVNTTYFCPDFKSRYVSIICKDEKNNTINGMMREYILANKIHRTYKVSTHIPNGFWTCYDDDNKLISELTYKNGKRHGVSKNYYENCSLLLEQYYKKGQAIKTIYIHDNKGNTTQKPTNEKQLVNDQKTQIQYIDADILINKFKSNIVAFNKEFDNKTIHSYGRIARIGTYDGYAYLMINEPYSDAIQCKTKDINQVANLQQGEYIKFYGKYKSNPYSMNLDIELEQCIIEKP